MQPTKTRADLWMDLLLVAFLIGFDVAARLLPHAPGVWPFAASALFAGRMLRIPPLAVIVPLAAVLRGSNVPLAVLASNGTPDRPGPPDALGRGAQTHTGRVPI